MTDRVPRPDVADVPSRRLLWISSSDLTNGLRLSVFQARMTIFYAVNREYYSAIDFAAPAWKQEKCYLEIIRRIRNSGAILEVGCGRANSLTAWPELAPNYTGVDLSAQLMAENAVRFPEAKFFSLTEAGTFPFPPASFDRVFCTYVLEHCVFPRVFLRECLRVLRPGGEFLLVCPDFLGRGRMTSQRAGFALGNGREKLRQGRWWDAVVTGFDRKVRIPLAAWRARQSARRGYGFWINVAPTCFVDAFYPDADAVYLTYAWEIVRELQLAGGCVDRLGDDPERIFISARLGECRQS